jgi:toxin ParE1/3/4
VTRRRSEASYIAQDDPAAAAEVAHRIVDATETLGKFPAAGRPGRVPGTRELIVSGTPYLLPYRVKEDVVEILRVLHAGRRWPEHRSHEATPDRN